MISAIPWTLAMVGLAVIMACSPSLAAERVDAVLDKAEQALGGQAVLADLQAVRIHSHGTWSLPPREITADFRVEGVFSVPNQIRILWHFPEELGGDFTFGYDGTNAWGIWGAPPARCLGWHREMIQHMATEMQCYLVAPMRAAYGDALALDAVSTDDASQTYQVSFRPLPEAGAWNLWFDRGTGLLVKMEHDSYHMDGKPILARSTRAMPNRFDGLVYPAHAKFEAIRDGQVIEVAEETIDSIELNPQLPADFFTCPEWEVDATTIDTKEVAEVTVVTFEHRGPYTDIGKSLEPMMDVILGSGLVPVEAVSATYLNDPNTTAPHDLRTELAVRVAKIKPGDPVLPRGYEFTTQPAMQVAYTYHRGDHNQEGEAHGRLHAWLAEQGLQPAGPPRAIWYHDPELTVTEDLISEVQIPLRRSP